MDWQMKQSFVRQKFWLSGSKDEIYKNLKLLKYLIYLLIHEILNTITIK